MASRQLPKLTARVRFPSPAPGKLSPAPGKPSPAPDTPGQRIGGSASLICTPDELLELRFFLIHHWFADQILHLSPTREASRSLLRQYF
jgi:hypothetical protein